MCDFKEDNKGMNRCKIFHEGHEDTVDVDDRFKIILLMSEIKETTPQQQLEQDLPAPFLNRFEKYTLSKKEFMNQIQIEEHASLAKMFEFAKNEKYRMNPIGVVHNLSDDLFLSIVMTSSGNLNNSMVKQQKGASWSPERFVMRILTDHLEQTSELMPKQNRKEHSGVSVKEQSHNQRVLGVAIFEEARFAFQQKNVLQYFSIVVNPKLSAKHDYVSLCVMRRFQKDEFRQVFLETHPDNSFADLVSRMKADTKGTLTKVVVFTYTSASDLIELLENDPKSSSMFDVRNATQLHQKNIRAQGEIVGQLVSDLSKILVVYFKNRQEWPVMQHLRYSIRTTPGSEHKLVIFTAHYEEYEVSCGDRVPSPTSYFSGNWEMVTIDDLRACNYEKCFELLQIRVIEALNSGLSLLTVESRHEYLGRIAIESLASMINKHHIIRDSIEKGTRVTDLLSKRDKIINFLVGKILNRQRLTSKGEMEEEDEEPEQGENNLLIKDLLKTKTGKDKYDVNFKSIFEGGNDLFRTLANKLTFSTQIMQK